MSDFFPALRVLGALLSFFSLGMFVPWVTSWAHADGLRHVWATSAAISLVCGAVLWVGLRHYKRELHPPHGIFLVSFTWVLLH
jgi:trk system potassium uptake protein TrkH